jgi:hypothetical protein
MPEKPIKLKVAAIVAAGAMIISLAATEALADDRPLSARERQKWQVELAIDGLDMSNPLITKDLVRAVYWHESRWRQRDAAGHVYSCKEKKARYRSWGIAQIYDEPRCRYPGIDYRRIKTDYVYNVRAGLKIMEEKFRDVRRIRRLYHIGRIRGDVEIGLSLYNGWQEEDRWGYAKSVLEIMRQRPWEADDER